MAKYQPAPTPASPDILSIVWQKWFLELSQIFRDIRLQFEAIDAQFVTVYNDITFIAQRVQYRSKAGLPTTGEQPLGTYSLWRNNTDATFRFVVRDSLGLRAFELTLLGNLNMSRTGEGQLLPGQGQLQFAPTQNTMTNAPVFDWNNNAAGSRFAAQAGGSMGAGWQRSGVNAFLPGDLNYFDLGWNGGAGG